MRFFSIILFVGALALTGCEVPQQQKVADCTTNSLDFSMTVEYSRPYAFVLGIPQSQTGQLSFRGEIVLQQNTGIVARIPISSHDVTPCSWLDSTAGLSGYILTWGGTNQEDRLSDVLVQRQTYDVHVTFDEPPPITSSLWLSSMKR
jgi:hypothetical protein